MATSGTLRWRVAEDTGQLPFVYFPCLIALNVIFQKVGHVTPDTCGEKMRVLLSAFSKNTHTNIP
jgi:hypothetical protein